MEISINVFSLIIYAIANAIFTSICNVIGQRIAQKHIFGNIRKLKKRLRKRP